MTVYPDSFHSIPLPSAASHMLPWHHHNFAWQTVVSHQDISGSAEDVHWTLQEHWW
jgi:hypothetical protein